MQLEMKMGVAGMHCMVSGFKMASWGYHRIQQTVHSLNEELRSNKNKEDKLTLVKNYIQAVENDSRFAIDTELPPNLAWFNVSSELTFTKHLSGKLVILDFFTYCCINCLHILPDLHDLEERFPSTDGLVIIGVHSAKFPNEKGTNNLRNAIAKYDICHPIVNDPDIIMWERLSISCWPTLVFINPQGRLLNYIIGEGHRDEMNVFTEAALDYYKEKAQLNFDPITLSLEKNKIVGGCDRLSFPGKIAATVTHLFVSDTGNHRVLMVNQGTGIVDAIYGNGLPGLRDGNKGGAQFRSPQGMAYDEGQLYVADTENHCIRKVGVAK